MNDELIQEIERRMLPHLNNEQLMKLKSVLEDTFHGLAVVQIGEEPKTQERDGIEAFIVANRIEGCSEKTLTYYRKTIEAMVSDIGKMSRQITTDDLRQYLTNYQTRRKSSKVTIDNIRRILSSFFSWLRMKTSLSRARFAEFTRSKQPRLLRTPIRMKRWS